MPVPVQSPINNHVGNGVTTIFPYQFLLLEAGDLVVTVDGVTKTLTSDYSISLIGNTPGGNITFTAAPASGAVIIFARVIALSRTTDYQDAGDFLAETVDDDFDRLWMVIQGMISGAQFGGQVALFPLYYTGSRFLPDPVANYLLGWNSSANALTNYEPSVAGGTTTIVQNKIPDFLLQNTGIA